MNKIIFTNLILALLIFESCAQNQPKEMRVKKKVQPKSQIAFKMTDFLSDNKALVQEVDKIFKSLDDTAIVAQLIMPAVGRLGQTEQTIISHINQRVIGGVLMLNGTNQQFKTWITTFEALNKEKGNLPFLYSADAEPSLFNNKILGSKKIKKANEIQSLEEVNVVAQTISDELKAIGINYNFAPVVDLAANKTVGYRGFGAIPANNIPFSDAFIQTTQKNNIIATAKHFPGHGLVSGDTHKSLQMIDGELKEIQNYPPLIKNGVLSIMVAHIAVMNNEKYSTKGLPATCSDIIVNKLLREEMGFKGLIVTDAMNMGGVTSVPNCELKAIQAGCDIALMPIDAKKAHADIIKLYNSNDAFKKQVIEASKRIIRMKLCLGLLK